MTLAGVARRFDRYWFAPAPLRDLALVRIIAFGLQTLYLVVPPVGSLAWVSSIRPLSSQLQQAVLGAALYQPLPALKVLLLPWGTWGRAHPSPELLTTIYIAAAVTSALAAVGLFARLTMPCAALANTFLVAHWYSYREVHHAETMMTVALFLLAISPSAEVWSVDAWRRRRAAVAPSSARASSPFARWPILLLQWLIALTYLSAAASKVRYGGLTWLNGYSMTYHYLAIGMLTNHPGALFLASLPPWTQVLPSFVTLLFEATFIVAVLVPRTARLYVVTGTFFHLAIFATMGIAFFQTIALYSVFVPNIRRSLPGAYDHLRARGGWPRRSPPAGELAASASRPSA